MTQSHRVASNHIEGLVESLLETLDGVKQGDAVVALFATSSRILQGEKPWEEEVRFVQNMLDYTSTIVGEQGRPN